MGRSNLILGTGRKKQTIIFNICIIFEKKTSEWKNFYQQKNLSKKNLLGKQFLSEKFCKKKFCWKKISLEEKYYQKIFLSESGWGDEHDLICIFVY